VIADMENITGARHWARILRTAVDGEPVSSGPAATEATEPRCTGCGHPDGESCGCPAPAGLREQYANDVECAIGLNVDCGGTEGVHRVRDAVLAVRDEQIEELTDRHRRLGIELKHWQTVIVPELRRERDLAIAHDRQPYPTAHAYDRACAALHKHRDRAELLTHTLGEVLNTFRTVRDDATRTTVGYISAPIHPTDYDRWAAVLEPAKEQQ
jgi:hypothetical protein